MISRYTGYCRALDIAAKDINKVSAFGGDYEHVDGVYGHLKMAQQNVAVALPVKVD